MPDFSYMNSLFQAVFAKEKADALKPGDFYPVLYFSEDFHETFPSLKNNLTEIITTDYLIGFDGVPYSEVDMSGIFESLEERLETNRLPHATPCCHTFFFCVKSNNDFDGFLKILNDIKRRLDPTQYNRSVTDHVVVFLCFTRSVAPDDETERCMNRLGSCFSDHFHTFVYSVPDVKFQKIKVENSIVGAALLMLGREGFSRICNNVSAVLRENEAYLNSIRSEFADRIRETRSPWANINCNIRFSKRDFLYHYCNQALTHLKSSESFEALAERLYSEIVDNRLRKDRLKSCLYDAVDRIPTIQLRKKTKQQDVYSYPSYFDTMYGANGFYTVTNTMQINMNMLCQRKNNEEILHTFIHNLLSVYAGRGSEHLMDEVRNELRQYRQKVGETTEAYRRNYENKIQNSIFQEGQDDLTYWVHELIDSYVESYLAQQKCAFWAHAVNTLEEEEEERYADEIRKSAEIFRIRDTLREEITNYRCRFSFGNYTCAEYDPADFMQLYEHRDLCMAIRDTFNRVQPEPLDGGTVSDGFEFGIRFAGTASLEHILIGEPQKENGIYSVNVPFPDYTVVGRQYSSGYFYLKKGEDATHAV